MQSLAKLLVVESPSLAKPLRAILQRYQPDQWHIVVTCGQLRTLPPMKGRRFEDVFDVDDRFGEHWIIDESKKQTIEELGEAISASSGVYLATSLSRVGETNAWHIKQHFGLENPRRVLLDSMRYSDVVDAVKNARFVSQVLVDSQRARAAVDYLVGMEVSHRLRAIGAKGIGRLQGCILRLIAHREQLAQEPQPAATYTVRCTYRLGDSEWSLRHDPALEQRKTEGRNEVGATPSDASGVSHREAALLAELARNHRHVVASVRRRIVREKPPLPLTTSSLLSIAAAKYGMSPMTAAAAAQALFEAGLITCPRTDAPYLPQKTAEGMRAYIGALWPNALPDHGVNLGRRRKGDDHREAIKPSVLRRVPMEQLPREQELVYALIFERTLMTQGRLSEHNSGTVTVEFEGADRQIVGRYIEPLVAGWKQLDSDFEPAQDGEFPADVGDELVLQQVAIEDVEPRRTERYTEASLIEYMATHKLGRASTYLGMVGSLEHRGYVVERDGVLAPTALGMRVDEMLRSQFDELFCEDFTRNTESCLEAIAAGWLRRHRFLANLHERFKEMLQTTATGSVRRVEEAR